ncbi:MAG TPA: sensor histidine kinase [Dokdonella sp.]|uniref:sensor histidine kinase n=1 Tax=Dokdonella sp. TaxID=2291710 RepID=UPI002D7FC884|nr:sensor histidine kinase [Dokdonella sp.]HET9032994.1 sensor histidine kinase [Dokdonella sp.]
MTVLRPRLRGLVSKLALFYVLLSLPTLIVVEAVILTYEFQRFVNGVEQGSLERATESGAAALLGKWPDLHNGGTVDATALQVWLDAWTLRLQQPRGGLTPDESYILLELNDIPLGAAIFDADNELLARTENNARWALDLPTPSELHDADGAVGAKVTSLASSDKSFTIQRFVIPLHDAGGARMGWLFVELRIPPPWRHLLVDSSFESPTVFAFLIVFGLASSLFLAAWVTRRLNRIERAAMAWSRGDFSNRIDDRSNDEIGGLSTMLDGMALDLKGLLRSRAQLAMLAERQRLARDLHDTVKQKAFALNLQLATARRMLGDTAGSERLELAQRLTQQIQQELAQILDEMRASDAELPFAERLRMRANDWAHSSGASLGFDINDVPSLAAGTEESLLRIVDEALSNVLRHSGAQHVDLSLRRAAERVSLIIDDNGSGAADPSTRGMGLRNMRDRAETLPGGHFEFDSTPGRGTRVTVSFQTEVTR